MKTIWKVGLILGALLGVALVALWLFGRPLYHQFRERHFLGQAQEHQARGDLRKAAISARQVLKENATNAAAWRLLADIAARAKLPNELEWRQRAVNADPRLENRLAFISAAMRRQPPPYPLAAQALQEAEPLGRESVAYHSLAAELAVKLRDPEAAEKHFAKACQLQPTNIANQLNLAVIHLGATNEALAAAARAKLAQLGGLTNLGPTALNWLIADSLARSNLTEALVMSKRLAAHPSSTVQEQVQNLELQWQAKDPALDDTLAALKTKAGASSADTLLVTDWMIGHNLAGPALAWMRSLPADIQAQQPAPTAIVNCLMALQEWAELQTFLKEPPWNEMEFFRQAFLALAAWQLKQDKTAETHWRSATSDAGERLRALIPLCDLARQWRRKAEYIEVLWMIADRFPTERWALVELDTIYQADANLRGLSRVYAAQLAYDPTNLVLRNNLAASGLLLGQNPAEIAVSFEPVWRAQTNHPAIVTTYAFALHRQGKTEEGLKLIEQLPADKLRLPAVATYYAVLLAESGRTNEAKPFVALARSVRLLPEEKALLDKLPLPPAP
jgi:hypothetical protein